MVVRRTVYESCIAEAHALQELELLSPPSSPRVSHILMAIRMGAEDHRQVFVFISDGLIETARVR
jgi:hypothetical protein